MHSLVEHSLILLFWQTGFKPPVFEGSLWLVQGNPENKYLIKHFSLKPETLYEQMMEEWKGG